MATSEVNLTNQSKAQEVPSGYLQQQPYVTPEAPPTYKQTVDTAQPQTVVVHTTPQTSGITRQPSPDAVRDYTIFAVIVTLIFCVPFGIVGIIKASEAKTKYHAGDEEGARLSSRSAFNWSMGGLVCGILGLLCVGIYLAIQS